MPGVKVQASRGWSVSDPVPLLDELSSCQADVQPLSIPPLCYTDEALVQAEVDALFRSDWIGIGRSDLVASPGDYATLDIVGQPIIIVRDHAGVARAFANTCRHRDARLLDGTGRCSGIRCPFHSWAYKLDGSLAGVPHAEGLRAFQKSEYNLVSYRLEERYGFLFLSFNSTASDLDARLGNFADVHAPWPLDTLVITRRRELTVACNWKAFLEVFNEYYHLPFVHPDSIDDVYNLPDPGDDVSGAFASQFGSTEGTGGLLQDNQDDPLPSIPGLAGREAAGVRYTWVFPNITFAAGTDALWIYEAYPLGAARCHVVQSACFPRETVDHPDFTGRVEAYYERLDAALAEDIPALVNQQRGLTSPDARQGPMHPLLESNVAAFAVWYATRMRVALS